jgi:hypothetical protein
MYLILLCALTLVTPFGCAVYDALHLVTINDVMVQTVSYC